MFYDFFLVMQFVLLIKSQQNYIKMASIELRSKSAQQKKQQRRSVEPQCKFDWIPIEKYQYGELKSPLKMASKEEKATRYYINKLHPSIQKVESIENMQVVGMKSAIQQLQDLATPRNTAENVIEYKRNHHHREQIPQAFNFQEANRVLHQQDSQNCNKNERKHNQTVQYYKGECQELKSQLFAERTKNQDLIALVKRLEHTNVQLQRQINLLIQKWQREQTASVKINELQQSFKQQLLLNLELEEILLKQKLQIQKKQLPKEQKPEQGYKTIIKEFKQRLTENKQMAQKEANTLRSVIEEKDKEIVRLKESIGKLNQQLPQEGITSLNQIELPSNNVRGNFMQRFVNFSKEMQAKLSQNKIVSTNPSLQDTALMDLQANRKHSQSEYSKGCPSVQIPLLVVRDVGQRGVSKTDRI